LWVVVRGAGGPLWRFFFGAPEKSSSTTARFADARGAFIVLRGAFLLLPDFAMNAASIAQTLEPGH
jgi:hypothetical protein